MHTFNIRTSSDWTLKPTDRVNQLMRLFGLRINRLNQRATEHHCQMTLYPGQICCITGSSGAGKSTLLNTIYNRIAAGLRIRLDEIAIETDRPMIDCLNGPLLDAVDALSKAGLSDVLSMLKIPCQLSAGQQWRYRLAKAMQSGRQWIFIDEFSASVDRITACVIAHNLRKIARRNNTIFILASCHEDFLTDLRPDVVIVTYLNGKTNVIYCENHKKRSMTGSSESVELRKNH